MDERLDANRKLWNALTGAHVGSDFYDVDGFKAGRECLFPIELAEMGDIAGRTLLHLQCHFGQDTLSWARKGAIVTGVDFSDEAIARARRLSDEIGVPAEFIQSNIYDLPAVLDRQFDIVYTSWGVKAWLPDSAAWGRLVGRYVKPGGTFYMVEFHPVIHVFNGEPDAAGLEATKSYFREGAARYEDGSDYASAFKHRMVSYEWHHTLADIVNALIAGGLRIEYLHEFPAAACAWFPFMERRDDGMWHLTDDPLPLAFSIRAIKPAD